MRSSTIFSVLLFTPYYYWRRTTIYRCTTRGNCRRSTTQVVRFGAWYTSSVECLQWNIEKWHGNNAITFWLRIMHLAQMTPTYLLSAQPHQHIPQQKLVLRILRLCTETKKISPEKLGRLLSWPLFCIAQVGHEVHVQWSSPVWVEI